MNVIKAMQDYVGKMVGDVPGLKVLLMDKETTAMVSMVYTQTNILQKDVMLVDYIGSKTRESMKHMKAIVFIRPAGASVDDLENELKNPKFSEYHIFFSNVAPESHIMLLAEADQHEAVQRVGEMFGDYYAVNRSLFSLNIESLATLEADYDRPEFQRLNDGLVSVLLALKKRPVVRYTGRSPLAHRVATEVVRRMERNRDLFDFRKSDSVPLLLIVDRKEDPVTPLLHQWTYQAQIHDLFTIKNNRVSLKGAPDIRKELEEVVMSEDTDEFFAKNMFHDFGHLGEVVQELTQSFQAKVHSTQQIDSIADMKRFIEQYPDFQKLSGSVSKHVSVMAEISRLVAERSLFDVSELEQKIAVTSDHDAHYKALMSLVSNPRIRDIDLVKLVMLYMLRYHNSSSDSTPSFLDALAHRGVDRDLLGYPTDLLKYLGGSVRSDDIFGTTTKNVFKMLQKTMTRGFSDTQGVYTQHVPLVVDTLTDLIKGKLSTREYPFEGTQIAERPQDIIVFFVGGCTFEEAVALNRFAAESNPKVNILLGGTFVHNSTTYLQEVRRVADAMPSGVGR